MKEWDFRWRSKLSQDLNCTPRFLITIAGFTETPSMLRARCQYACCVALLISAGILPFTRTSYTAYKAMHDVLTSVLCCCAFWKHTAAHISLCYALPLMSMKMDTSTFWVFVCVFYSLLGAIMHSHRNANTTQHLKRKKAYKRGMKMQKKSMQKKKNVIAVQRVMLFVAYTFFGFPSVIIP